MKYKIINKCLLCNDKLELIYSFGSTPLANEFVENKCNQDLFPLNLVKCIGCNHIQIDCIVDKERLYSNYFYVSGTSKVNVKHFEEYALDIINNFDLNKQNYSVLDIGSNDGTFLKTFVDHNYKVIGVDPAANLKEQALKNGVETLTMFFTKDNAAKIKKELRQKIPIITCNNMFAHNEDLISFIEGIDVLLDDNGVFVFENSYLIDILDKTLIDLVYHEHMHHHHISPLQKLFKKFDMEIFDVKRIPNHGGSFRAFVCRKGTRNIQQSVIDILTVEQDLNIKIEKFKSDVSILKNKIKNRLKDFELENKKIIIYGVPAKATTLMYALDIDSPSIIGAIDDNPLKQNMLTPGKQIPIFSDNIINKADVILILAWNFADSIIKNHSDFKGKWIVPLPEYIEYSLEE